MPEVLTLAQLEQTAHSIARQQHPWGAIPWYAAFDGYPPGHVDAWNHVEAAMALRVVGLDREVKLAYEWLASEQRPDGSWPQKWVDGTITEDGGESNDAAYVAVGIWHDLLITGDEGFARRMWPVVRRALDYAVSLQNPFGDMAWVRHPDGSTDTDSLLTGSSSIYQALRCGVALAEHLGEPQPGWELAADQLGHVVARHPKVFMDKSRWSMDWYYPVLGGALRGAEAAAHLDDGWDRYVVDGLGCRCVHDQPWITAAETSELVLALDAVGDPRAEKVFADLQFLRHEDGSYWTGWQFAHQRHFPGDRSTYTAAAVVLAADALADRTPGARIFKEIAGRPLGPAEPADPEACGCAEVPARI